MHKHDEYFEWLHNLSVIKSRIFPHTSIIFHGHDRSSWWTPVVCCGMLVGTVIHDMTLIILEVHLDLFLFQVQVEAPWSFQEVFLWAVGLGSQALLGFEQPVTPPFANVPLLPLHLALFCQTCFPSELKHLRSQVESIYSNEGWAGYKSAMSMNKKGICECTRWRWLLLSGRWYQRLVWQQVLQILHHLIGAVLVVPTVLLLFSSLKWPAPDSHLFDTVKVLIKQ